MEHALQRLRMHLMSGKLSPGEQIRQQEMAEHIGVSRVPLREALNVLAKQGLLLHRPNQGYFVIKRAPGELEQIRRMLHLLENELMGSIVWPELPVIERFRLMNDEMRRHIPARDWELFPQLNRDFHLAIFDLSPDRLILEQVQRLWALADRFIAAKFENVAARARTVEEHEAIIDALEVRQKRALKTSMELHRSSNAEGYSKVIAEVKD